MFVYSAPKCLHWKPYTGPRSPSSLSVNPRLSRKSRDPLASQIFTPFSDSSLEFVDPLMNHSSSSRIPLQNTLFVVNRGNWSVKDCKKKNVTWSCWGSRKQLSFADGCLCNDYLYFIFNVMPVYTCKSITVVSRLKGADDFVLGRLFHITSCSPSVFSTFNTQIQCHASCKVYLSGCIWLERQTGTGLQCWFGPPLSGRSPRCAPPDSDILVHHRKIQSVSASRPPSSAAAFPLSHSCPASAAARRVFQKLRAFL